MLSCRNLFRVFQQPCDKPVNLRSFLFAHCSISSRSVNTNVHLI
nr:MAG TPA: hypothetical protein [Caudoviricetes sp.]